jgi:hypothetical protein
MLLLIKVANSSGRQRIIERGIFACEQDRLIRTQPGAFIHGARVAATKEHVLAGPHHKERGRQCEPIKRSRMNIAAIHDVKRSGFGGNTFEDAVITGACSRDFNHCGNAAVQGLEGCVASRQPCRASKVPSGTRRDTDQWWWSREHRRSDQVPHRTRPVRRAGVLAGSTPGPDRHKCASRAFHWHAPTCCVIPCRGTPVIEARLCGAQTSFNITQTPTVTQLSKGQRQKLIQTREALNLVLSLVSFHTGAELRHGESVSCSEKRQFDR